MEEYSAQRGILQVVEEEIRAELAKGDGKIDLEGLVRNGARKILAQALVVEINEYLEKHDQRDEKGNRVVYRNGYAREREIWTGIGPIQVKQPRVDDRKAKEKFSSRILPKYMRRVPSIDNLLPVLYLRGVSTGDFSDALESILGKGNGVSANTIVRLKKEWQAEYAQWCKRRFDTNEYCYIWVDGIYMHNRDKEDPKSCNLVVVGVNQEGDKEFLAIESGFRESALSWKDLLLDLKNRGLQAPKLAIGDGAMGFWVALQEVYPQTRQQRCWVHKTANVLDKLPKTLQPKAKTMLQEIYLASNKTVAQKKMGKFLRVFEDKYPKATKCLEKDKEELLTFFDFPAEHFQHIRTSNPIESTFATVRLRTKRMRNCGNRMTNLAMLFKLSQEAQKGWRKLMGYRKIPYVLAGKNFSNGELVKESVA
ncbi:MAG TPA: IS256 family transposase [Thermotogota bacterium]|nr:IS256 family transposase [Thermotogota bacterium]